MSRTRARSGRSVSPPETVDEQMRDAFASLTPEQQQGLITGDPAASEALMAAYATEKERPAVLVPNRAQRRAMVFAQRRKGRPGR